MKKIGLLMISILMVIGLTGCYNYNDIEKNFEDIGYEFSSDASNVAAIFKTELTALGIEVDAFVFTDNESSVAIVFDFEDEDDIDTAFTSNTMLTDLLVDGYTQEELTRDHYVVVPISGSTNEKDSIIEAFQD